MTQRSNIGAFQQTAITELGAGRLVHIAGLTSGEQAPFDMQAQAELIFEKMRKLLNEAGGDLHHLVKINAYVVDMREYDAYNAVRNRIFSKLAKLPASATVGCSALIRPGNRVEIDGVAYIPAAA